MLKATLLQQGAAVAARSRAAATTLDLEQWRGEARLQEREFEMAAALTRGTTSEQDRCEAPPQVLFPQMLEIVKRFVRDRVIVDDEREADRRLPRRRTGASRSSG